MAATPYYAVIDGKKVRVPRVTTILGVLDKPALLDWGNRLGLGPAECEKRGLRVVKGTTGPTAMKDHMDPLAAIGTLAHAMVEEDLGGPKPDLTLSTDAEISAAENAFLSWCAFRKEHDFQPLATEIELISPTMRVGGRCDALGTLDGSFALVDFKTGSGVYDEAWIQVSAYKAIALELWDTLPDLAALVGKPFDFDCWIVNIPRSEDEDFRAVRVAPEASAVGLEIFTHAREIYRLQRELKVHTMKEYQEWQVTQA